MSAFPSFGPQPPPNIADYITFIRNVAGIPANYLPDSSPNIQYSFDNALNWTNEQLGNVPTVTGVFSPYSQAVYNLGVHGLIEYCPDQSWPISAVSWANNLATVKTSVPNTVQVGDRIMLSGVSPLLYIQPGRSGTPPNPAAPIYVNSVIDASDFNYPVSPFPGAAILAANAAVSEYYFANLRVQFRIAQFTPGLVSSTSDTGTSASLVTPHWAAGLGIYSLSLTKTPWGRAWLAISASFGPTIFGLTM